MNNLFFIASLFFLNTSLSFASEPLNFNGWNRCFDQVDPEHYSYNVSAYIDPITGNASDQVTIFTKSNTPSLADHLIFYPYSFDVTPIAGQTIKFSADVLIEDLANGTKADGTTVNAGVGLWMEASRHLLPEEGDTKSSCYLFLDSTKNRRITTLGMNHIEIISHMPQSVEEYTHGVSLYGNGKVTFFNVKLETIDPSTPELTMTSPVLTPNAYRWCKEIL